MRSVGSRWQRWLVGRVRFHGATDGVVIAESLLDDRWLERLRDRVPVLVVWGVRDVGRARALIAAGVDGLIVDDLEILGRLGS